MANDLSSLLKYNILPNSIAVLRENAKMARMVWNDFDESIVDRNQKISISIPADLGDAVDMNFTSGNTPKNITPTNVEVVMDQWKEQIFQLSDKELAESMVKGHLPAVIESAVKGMANTIDKALLNLGKDIYQFSGTAGTTPQTVAAYTGLRKAMNNFLIPDETGMRNLVIDTEAEDYFNQLFYNAQTVGQTATLESGALVRKFNMDIMMDQNVQYMTNGTSTAATFGTCAAGASSANLTGAGASATIKDGQLFTVAGISQQFVAVGDHTADGAGAVTGFTFDPPAPVALTGLAITFIASHRMNLAFARKAFAIAWRPISSIEAMPGQNVNSVRETMVDPVSGIPMTMEMWREPKTAQNLIAIRMAYGLVAADKRLAVRFLG